jgi:lysophospholipase L1-like esterase
MKKETIFVLVLCCVIALGCCGAGDNDAAAPSVGEDVAAPPVREDIEWLDVWVPDNNESGLPRVLLIGNSITRAYYPEVAENLRGVAFTARLATSKSLGDPALIDEIELVMKHTRFDVVHFNNGLHGFGYTEQEYGAALPEMIAAIKAHSPDAKLIWASTTPTRQGERMEEFAPGTERVKERNRIALEVMQKYGIVCNDLFAVVEPHPEYYTADGIHLLDEGTTALARKVSDEIRKIITKQ